MRRAATVLLVLVLMGIATIALAGWQNYKDSFSSGGYSGNDGSLKWNGSWKEVGENNGASSGAVQVTGSGCSGQCLSIEAGLLGSDAGAYRLADTGEFANGQLSYDVAFDGGGLLGLLTGKLTVQVKWNGSWTTVDTVTLDTNDDDLEHRSVSVSEYLSEDFGVQFLVTGTLGASVIIDNVQVGGDLIPPTTTTTSTTTTTTPTTTTTTPSTTTSSTTTTTTTTTLITLPPTTLPKLPTTSSTTSTTTTTIRPNTTPSSTTTTTTPSDGEDRDPTTTQPSTTTTIAAGIGAGGGGPTDTGGGSGEGTGDGGGSGEGSEDGATSQRTSGLLQPPVGLGADIPTDLFGSTAPEVLGFDIAPGFSDAVELIEASWIWVLALALLIAGALVKGIDRRVSPIPAAPDPTG